MDRDERNGIQSYFDWKEDRLELLTSIKIEAVENSRTEALSKISTSTTATKKKKSWFQQDKNHDSLVKNRITTQPHFDDVATTTSRRPPVPSLSFRPFLIPPCDHLKHARPLTNALL
ncbi:hypothetical protein L1887_31512 [Cichorium endivia]|nr:hypothetical protein L1887_31512 [Cichorium endivia]